MLIEIDQAGADQWGEVLGVLDEAAAWLQKAGITQWPARFSGRDDWREERLRSYLVAGETWLVRGAGKAIATFTLSGPDPDYAHGWPGGADDALYLYRMAVRRKHAGAGLGDRILDWCGATAAATGRSWLRLDCHRENHVLQRYYTDRGFARVGTVVHTIPATANSHAYVRGSGALYQRPAGTISVPDSQITDTPTSSQIDPPRAPTDASVGD